MDKILSALELMDTMEGGSEAPKRFPPRTIKQREAGIDQLFNVPKMQPTGLQQQFLDFQIDKLSQNVKELNKTFVELNSRPTIISDRIYSLPSEKYEIIQPINILFKIFNDEILAIIPELEIYGEGKTEMDALNDLKLELIDLLEDLEDTPEDQLGKYPLSWKKALDLMVKVCR
jgi:hypothetical protein